MPESSHYSANVTTNDATIASSGTVSGAIDLHGTTLVGMFMPSVWTAADMTFQASDDNSTFVAMYNADGTALTVSVAASRYVILDPADFAGVRYVKLVSSNAQAAERVITIVARPV